MNNKIKIVATVAISTMLLAGCGSESPLMGAPMMPPPKDVPKPPTTESKQKDSNGFVNVDPPVGLENSGEEATE